jgi:hypothetical protein
MEDPSLQFLFASLSLLLGVLLYVVTELELREQFSGWVLFRGLAWFLLILAPLLILVG